MECTRKHGAQSNVIDYKDEMKNVIVSADYHHLENATAAMNNSSHTSLEYLFLSTSSFFTSCE